MGKLSSWEVNWHDWVTSTFFQLYTHSVSVEYFLILYITLTIATVVTQWCIFLLYPHFIKYKDNHKYQFLSFTKSVVLDPQAWKLPPFWCLLFIPAKCNFIKYHWFVSSTSIWNHVLEVGFQGDMDKHSKKMHVSLPLNSFATSWRREMDI